MVDAKVDNNRIEGLICVWQGLGIGLLELDQWVQAARLSEHGGREISASDSRAALERKLGHISGTACGIQDPGVLDHARRVE
jgi:hypothetical protein